jgi:hypothetical protein
MLKEEIHLVKKRGKGRVVEDVQLDRERAEVHRVDEGGRIVGAERGRAPFVRPNRKRTLL